VTDEERKEWIACVAASHKTVQVLMDITTGPRQGLIAACMLLITVANACDVEKENTVDMLMHLWEVFDNEADRPIQ
jgi:hypothetical protein